MTVIALVAGTRDSPPGSSGSTEWRQIGHANSVAAMAASGDKLFAATCDNRLFTRAI